MSIYFINASNIIRPYDTWYLIGYRLNLNLIFSFYLYFYFFFIHFILSLWPSQHWNTFSLIWLRLYLIQSIYAPFFRYKCEILETYLSNYLRNLATSSTENSPKKKGSCGNCIHGGKKKNLHLISFITTKEVNLIQSTTIVSNAKAIQTLLVISVC